MSRMRAAQRAKRDAAVPKRAIKFGWINQNYTRSNIRLILVATGVYGNIRTPKPEVTLTAMVWDCAGIESPDQRSRVLKKIDQRCEGYWVERRDGRTAVLHKGKNPNENTPNEILRSNNYRSLVQGPRA